MADLAMLLIRRARKLYCNDSFSVDLTNTVYALGATTIDLCLSLFPWAPFRTSKAAVKLHTLLDLLSFEAGAFYVMDRGYLDFSRKPPTQPPTEALSFVCSRCINREHFL